MIHNRTLWYQIFHDAKIKIVKKGHFKVKAGNHEWNVATPFK